MSDILIIPRNVGRIDLAYDGCGTKLVIQVWRKGDAVGHALVDDDDPKREFTFTLIRDGVSYHPTSFHQDQEETPVEESRASQGSG